MLPADRDGYVNYHEGSNAASFYWEFGGGDVVAIIHVGKTDAWSNQYPWAANCRREILERVAQGVIRERAPGCKADIDEQGGFIYIREQKALA